MQKYYHDMQVETFDELTEWDGVRGFDYDRVLGLNIYVKCAESQEILDNFREWEGEYMPDCRYIDTKEIDEEHGEDTEAADEARMALFGEIRYQETHDEFEKAKHRAAAKNEVEVTLVEYDDGSEPDIILAGCEMDVVHVLSYRAAKWLAHEWLRRSKLVYGENEHSDKWIVALTEGGDNA